MRTIVRATAGLGLLAAVAFAAPASAGPLNNQLACVASGKVDVSTPVAGVDDTVTWRVHGAGICTGDFRGPHAVTFNGSGTSTNLGLCDGLLAQDLDVDVSLHLISNASGLVRDVAQSWTAPATTFPVTTPFLVEGADGDADGAGSLFTRVGGRCPPGGSNAANFEWQFVLD